MHKVSPQLPVTWYSLVWFCFVLILVILLGMSAVFVVLVYVSLGAFPLLAMCVPMEAHGISSLG